MAKVYDGIMGLVVGDALGVPFEFKKRGSFVAAGMCGYGTYNQPPGTWSDDSSMTIATVESLTRMGCIDLADIMENFYCWYSYADFTAHKAVFDVGRTTRQAIERYIHGFPVDACGGRFETDNGNGALMRILPLAFIPHSIKDIHNVAGLTHAHDISQMCCEIYVAVAKGLISGTFGPKDLRFAVCDGTFGRLGRLHKLSRNEIKSTGFVVDTLEAALWCFMNTDSYAECVLKAVNLGEDTDTVAAVAGGLAGIYYGIGGEQGIPEEWIDQIARKNAIKKLCEAFERKFSDGGVKP